MDNFHQTLSNWDHTVVSPNSWCQHDAWTKQTAKATVQIYDHEQFVGREGRWAVAVNTTNFDIHALDPAPNSYNYTVVEQFLHFDTAAEAKAVAEQKVAHYA